MHDRLQQIYLELLVSRSTLAGARGMPTRQLEGNQSVRQKQTRRDKSGGQEGLGGGRLLAAGRHISKAQMPASVI